MSHPLTDVINSADGFLVIGDSGNDRFPGFSYNAYTRTNKRFFCLDLGGLTASRGPTKGGRVYTSVAELPAGQVGDLAILWVKPRDSKGAVDLAHEAGCTRIWFSFQTGHVEAVQHARDLGMTVVEIGRCPVYYLDDAPAGCKAHTLIARVSGTWKRPPQLDATADRRELW